MTLISLLTFLPFYLLVEHRVEVLSCLVLSCLVLYCLVLSCLVLPWCYVVLCCLVFSCHFLPDVVLFVGLCCLVLVLCFAVLCCFVLPFPLQDKDKDKDKLIQHLVICTKFVCCLTRFILFFICRNALVQSGWVRILSRSSLDLV
jgi:hypothetical protein